MNETRVPVVEEALTVERREGETGRVRVRTFVDERLETVSTDLNRRRVIVDRVPIGREIASAPSVREEDDGTVVVPVFEERVVIEKRLFLVEELHLRPTDEHTPFTAEVSRRVMRATIERDDLNSTEIA